MRFLVIVIVFVFGGTTLQGQNTKYNRTVNEAQNLIAKEEFAEALDRYTMLSTESSMFAIDIHNALVCAIFLNNENDIKYFGQLLSQKGLPRSYFLQKAVFAPLKEQAYWIEFADNSELMYQKLNTKHRAFIEEIEVLKNRDDSLFRLGSTFDPSDLDARERVASLSLKNKKELLNLFEANFFPGENFISQYVYQDTFLFYNPPFFSMLNSADQSKYSKEEGRMIQEESIFKGLLEQEMLNNNIKPETYALAMDIPMIFDVDKRTFYGTCQVFLKNAVSIHDKEIFTDKNLYERKGTINLYRNSIGLGTLEEMLGIMKFAEQDKYWNVFIFPMFWQLTEGISKSNLLQLH